MSDIMSHMDLAVWPTIGLVLFLIVFTIVVLWSVTAKRQHSQHMASLPLNDDDATADIDIAHINETGSAPAQATPKGASRGA